MLCQTVFSWKTNITFRALERFYSFMHCCNMFFQFIFSTKTFATDQTVWGILFFIFRFLFWCICVLFYLQLVFWDRIICVFIFRAIINIAFRCNFKCLFTNISFQKIESKWHIHKIFSWLPLWCQSLKSVKKKSELLLSWELNYEKMK